MGHNLYFYRVKEWYTNRLHAINPRGVTLNNHGHINTYVGILVNINDVQYIAPLTHKTKKDKWHQVPIVNVVNNSDEHKLGTILLHNMIPVYTDNKNPVYEKVDMDVLKCGSEDEVKKYNLYQEQLHWINQQKHKTTITDRAKKTYDVFKDTGHPDHSFLINTLFCDFDILETEMRNIQQEGSDTV